MARQLLVLRTVLTACVLGILSALAAAQNTTLPPPTLPPPPIGNATTLPPPPVGNATTLPPPPIGNATTLPPATTMAPTSSPTPLLPYPANGAYCSGDLTVLVNGPYFAIFADSATVSMCRRLFTYGVDLYGNITLNELDQSGCYDELTAYAAYVDVATKIIHIALIGTSGLDPQWYLFDAMTCVNTTGSQSSNFATGVYCGASDETIVATGKIMIWRTAGAEGDDCAFALDYGAMATTELNVHGYASGCTSGITYGFYIPSLRSVAYDAVLGVIGIRFYYMDRAVTMSTASCGAAADVQPNLNGSYCVADSAVAGLYRKAALRLVNASAFNLVLPTASYSDNQVCLYEGRISSKGNVFSFDGDDFFSSCYNVPYLVSAWYDPAADTFTFTTMDTTNLLSTFTAAPCQGNAVIPLGEYCAGKNAYLYIANETYTLITDVLHEEGRCRIDGTFVLGASNASTTRLTSNCSGIDRSTALMSVSLDTVYFTFEWDNHHHGLAFRKDSCAVNATPAVGGSYCAPVDSGDAILHIAADTFALTLNNTWINAFYSTCVYSGALWARGQYISFIVSASGCGQYAYTAYVDFVWRNWQYAAATTSYQFELVNDTGVQVLSLLPCARAVPAFDKSAYCGLGGDRFYVQGSNFYLVSPIREIAASGRVLSVNGSLARLELDASSVYTSNEALQAHILSTDAISVGNQQPMTATHGFDSTACVSSYVEPKPPVGTYCASIAAGQYNFDGFVAFSWWSANSSFTFLVAASQENGNPCFGYGSAYGLNGVLGLDFADSANCANWNLHYVKRDAATNALTLAIEYNDGGVVTLSIANNTCAGWEQGVLSGVYCPPPANNTLQYGVLGNWLANYTRGVAVASFTKALTNLTFTKGYDALGNDRFPVDYVNTVGTRGLSASGDYRNGAYTVGVNLDACFAPPVNRTDVILASDPLPELGGKKITVAFTAEGAYTIVFPLNESGSCFASGAYDIAAMQLSLTETSRKGCGGIIWRYSRGAVAADNSVILDLWVSTIGGSVTVTFKASNCLPFGGLYCDGLGNRYFECNGTFVTYGRLYTVGNVTIEANGSYVSRADSGDEAIYTFNETTGAVAATGFTNLVGGIISMSLCPMSLPLPAAVGSYCGTDGSGANLMALTMLPNGAFGLSYVPPQVLSANPITCYHTGTLLFEKGGYGFWSFTEDAFDACWFDNGQPRIRFDSIRLDNATGTITFAGFAWTAEDAVASAITYVLRSRGVAACQAYTEQTALDAAQTPFIRSGVYTASAANVTATAVITGSLYGLHIWLSGVSAIAFGKYVPTLAALQVVDIGIGSANVLVKNETFYTFTNATYNAQKGLLQLVVTLGISSGNLVLPLAYVGVAPAFGV